MKFVIYSFTLLFLFAKPAAAQNITGTWEGMMDDQFIQLNITQKGTELCGYTWDSVRMRTGSSYCKAYFSGRYDGSRKEWLISGTNFIRQSGGHILMRIILRRDELNAKVLRGIEVPKGAGMAMTFGAGENMVLRKISNKPQKPGPGMSSCFKETVKKDGAPDPRDKVIITPKRPLPPPQNKLPQPPVIKDSVAAPPIVVAPKPNPVLPQQLTTRKNKAFKTLQVNTRKITLDVYDNGTIDGDTVSIFYNGKLLLNKKRLSDKPLKIELELDENPAAHEITLFAENLGSIPPNTALIVVTAGPKRYELFSSASLQENAVLILEYKPN